MRIERWRVIVLNGEITNYRISDHGNIRKVYFKTVKIGGKYITQLKQEKMKPQVEKTGYISIRLRCNGNRPKVYIHRLVANVFVNNEYNKSDVDHIDNDKSNNHYSNLQWLSKAENTQKMWKDIKRKREEKEQYRHLQTPF